MAYLIEKNIPAPAPKGKSTKYPFSEMAVGDSFLVTENRESAKGAAIGYGKRNGCKFTVRCEGMGYRIWRIA